MEEAAQTGDASEQRRAHAGYEAARAALLKARLGSLMDAALY